MIQTDEEKDILSSWTGRINIVKMPMLSIYKLGINKYSHYGEQYKDS